jgi:hypothetical protein
LHKDLDSYAKKDAEDHARLYTAIGGVKKDVDDVKKQVGGMSTSFAEACGKIEIMSGILEEQRDAREIERKDKLDSHMFRRKLMLKVAAVVAPLAAGLTHLIHILSK